MSCYNDLVDNVATLMKYWYKNEVSGCYKEGMSAPTPSEYVITTDSMKTAIKCTLISDDDIMCVIAEHISNPWDVMNGGEPNYDCGDSAYVRFWFDCAKAFYDEVNPTISAMMNNDHWND